MNDSAVSVEDRGPKQGSGLEVTENRPRVPPSYYTYCGLSLVTRNFRDIPGAGLVLDRYRDAPSGSRTWSRRGRWDNPRRPKRVSSCPDPSSFCPTCLKETLLYVLSTTFEGLYGPPLVRTTSPTHPEGNLSPKASWTVG